MHRTIKYKAQWMWYFQYQTHFGTWLHKLISVNQSIDNPNFHHVMFCLFDHIECIYLKMHGSIPSNKDSEPMALTCGVPQGSILGPILFLCYVNDMPNCVDCVLLQYADDSALIVSDKDPIKLVSSSGKTSVAAINGSSTINCRSTWGKQSSFCLAQSVNFRNGRATPSNVKGKWSMLLLM